MGLNCCDSFHYSYIRRVICYIPTGKGGVLDYQNINEAVNQETKEREISLWGDKVTFTPEIASEIIGDGKQLLQIWALGQRPHYWLIRIDSETNIETDDFDIESCVGILEEEFGLISEEDINSDKTNEELYPQIYWDGGVWESVFIENKN